MPPRPPPTQGRTACVHRRRVREQHNRTGMDEGKWTRRILDSYGAAAADEGPDERCLASTPLPITRRRTKLGSSISQEKIVSDPREAIDRGIYKPAGALAWMLVSLESPMSFASPALLTAKATNLQPRTMWESRMVKSPRDSGFRPCLCCFAPTSTLTTTGRR